MDPSKAPKFDPITLVSLAKRYRSQIHDLSSLGMTQEELPFCIPMMLVSITQITPIVCGGSECQYYSRCVARQETKAPNQLKRRMGIVPEKAPHPRISRGIVRKNAPQVKSRKKTALGKAQVSK